MNNIINNIINIINNIINNTINIIIPVLYLYIHLYIGYPDWGFSVIFPQFWDKCQGINPKKETRRALFQN